MNKGIFKHLETKRRGWELMRLDVRKALSRLIVVGVQFNTDIIKPKKRKPATLEKALAYFRRRRFTFSPGSSGFFTVTPLPGLSVYFQNLTAGEEYAIQPYWEPIGGLRIYFVGKEVVAYDFNTRLRKRRDGNLFVCLRIVGRADSLEKARSGVWKSEKRRGGWLVQDDSIRKGLALLITRALRINPLGPPPEELSQLEEELAVFRKKQFTARIGASGAITISPWPRYVLEFKHLIPHAQYLIQPYWEHTYGLRLYFVGKGNVIGYGIDCSLKFRLKSKTRKRGGLCTWYVWKGCFPIMIRAQDLETARAMCWLGRIRDPVRHQLADLILAGSAVDPQFPQANLLEEIEKQLTDFKSEGFTISSDVTGHYNVTIKRRLTITFTGFQPRQEYLLVPIWEPNFGLHIYFVGKGDTRGYGIANFKSRLCARARDLNSARTLHASGHEKRLSGHARKVTKQDGWELPPPISDLKHPLASQWWEKHPEDRRLLFRGENSFDTVLGIEWIVRKRPSSSDTFIEVSQREFREKIRNLLLSRYTAEEAESILEIGDVVADYLEDGLTVRKALEKAAREIDFPLSRCDWLFQQWRDVLPQLLGSFDPAP